MTTTPNGITTGDTITIRDGLGTTAAVTEIRYGTDLVTNVGVFHYSICTKQVLTEGQHRDLTIGDTTIRIVCVRPGFAYRVASGRVIGLAGFREDEDGMIRGFATEAEATKFVAGYADGLREVGELTSTMPEPEFVLVRRRPVRKGTSLRVSDSVRQVLIASHHGQIIRCGGHPGQLTTPQLAALNDRGLVVAYARQNTPYKINHAVVTEAGVRYATR